MDSLDLLLTQTVQPRPSPFQAQRQIFPRLILLVRLKRNHMEALFAVYQCLQTRYQCMFAEEKDMRPPFRTALSQSQQRLNGCPG